MATVAGSFVPEEISYLDGLIRAGKFDAAHTLLSDRGISTQEMANWVNSTYGKNWSADDISGFVKYGPTYQPGMLTGTQTNQLPTPPSGGKDMWYGANPSRTGSRAEFAADNAKIVKDLLRSMYPDAPQEQLDAAAAKAYNSGSWKNDPEAGGGWNEMYRPNDVAREIAAQMPGGLTAQNAQYLQSLQPVMTDRQKQIEASGYKWDKDNASSWVKLRDKVEAAAAVVGNYFYPGSALLTSNLVSDGAKEYLATPAGRAALLASGVSGAAMGQFENYGKTLDWFKSGAGTTTSTVTGQVANLAPTEAELLKTVTPTIEKVTQGVSLTASESAALEAAYSSGLFDKITGGAMTAATKSAIEKAVDGVALTDADKAAVKSAADAVTVGGSLGNMLTQTGLGVLGGYFNQEAARDTALIQAQAQREALAANQAYAKEMTQSDRDYAAQLDALQQARLAGYNTAATGALSALTPAQVAAQNAQFDLDQQGMLSKAGLENLAAQKQSQAGQNLASGLAGLGERAVEMSKFTPVGMTTRFGVSDAQGNYNLTPEMKAQQDALMGISGGALSQYQGAQAATAPMGAAAQSMFQLGQGYLGTSPQEQAAKYYADQQALLETNRSRESAALENRLMQQGRLGIATGATGRMGAANPEMEALANARRQQDLALAAQATQGGQQYAQFGAGMMGAGAKTLQDMYGTQAAAYTPYQTAMGGVQNLEQLAQQARTMGIDLGKLQSDAGYRAAGLGSQLGTQALQAQYAAMANPAQYADYLAMQQGAISGMTPFQRAASSAAGTAAEKQAYLDQVLKQTGMFAQAAAGIPSAGKVVQAPMAQPGATATEISPWGRALTGMASSNYDWSKLWSQ